MKKWCMRVKNKGAADEDAWWEECSWCDGRETEEEARRQAVACVRWFNDTLRSGEVERVVIGLKEKKNMTKEDWEPK